MTEVKTVITTDTAATEYGKMFLGTLQDVENWCVKYKIPADHGFEHYVAVVENFELADTSKQSADDYISNLLACLLHDVDDRKLRKALAAMELKLTGGQTHSIVDYGWAKMFLKKYPADIRDSVLKRISLVSASTNGNNVDDVSDPSYLYARDCDRLESIGEIGIRRCMEYSVRHGIPLCVPSTPLAVTRAELDSILASRSIDDYVKSGGKSNSMLDHYVDKLLYFDKMATGDMNLQKLADSRIEEMRQFYYSVCRVMRMVVIPDGGLPLHKDCVGSLGRGEA